MSYVIENNIIKSEDVKFDFSALGGIGNVIFNSMKKNGKNVAQIDPVSGRQDTYEHLLRNAIRTAITMKSKGIKKGDIIMGCSDNHLDACIPIVAAMFLGAIPCSIDPSLTTVETKHILNQIQPKMIFTIPSFLERVKEVCRELYLDAELVVFESCQQGIEFKVYLEKHPKEEEFRPIISTDPKETAVIYFSSGTTGLAKACCLSHQHFINQSNLVRPNIPNEVVDVERMNFEFSQFKTGGSCLCYSPLYWITGGRFLIETMFMGSARVLCKKFDPKAFWHVVEKYRVLLVLLLPYHMLELTRFERPPNVTTESLVKILTGGAALQKKHWKILQDMLPDTDIVQCYGLTETGVITGFETYHKAHRQYYRSHPECVGFPIRGIWYKVVDPDTKEILGPNQEGELLIRSSYFMNGYYNHQLNDIYDSDGWFKTGDIVYYKNNCAFYITDRLKELLKYRQLTVYPYVIEQVLLKHPAVAEAVSLGVPHEEDGERPAAFVILNEGFENVNAEEIRSYLDDKMQDKAKLRGGLWIVKSFPMTSTGKVKRRELRRIILPERFSTS